MPISLPPDLMVSVSGFRGRVGECMTPELVAGLAAAYGDFLRRGGGGAGGSADAGAASAPDDGPVIVGRDTRSSGPMLMRAAVAGLMSAGRRVVEVGVVPTPTLMLAVKDADAAGGLMVTASHNPAEWNALKFAQRGGTFLAPPRMKRFQARLREQDPVRAPWDAVGSVEHDGGAVERHLERIFGLVSIIEPNRIRERGLRVALDCVNGAGAVVLPGLLERLGCETSVIGGEPHGRFFRDPEPTAASLAALGELVRSMGADVGLAVDPDADRLSLVDETGRALGEDLTLALAADVVLRRRPGMVVTNQSTSRVLEDVAAARGCGLARTPVGEANVVEGMIRESAVVGGEGNGGVVLPALQLTRDAPVGVALVLQYLADEPGARLSERVARLPWYSIVKEKMAFPRERLGEAYETLAGGGGGAEIDRSDGMRIDWPGRKAWLHVRPSGTEPVVRIIAEAPDAAAAQNHVDGARRLLESVAGRADA